MGKIPLQDIVARHGMENMSQDTGWREPLVVGNFLLQDDGMENMSLQDIEMGNILLQDNRMGTALLQDNGMGNIVLQDSGKGNILLRDVGGADEGWRMILFRGENPWRQHSGCECEWHQIGSSRERSDSSESRRTRRLHTYVRTYNTARHDVSCPALFIAVKS